MRNSPLLDMEGSSMPGPMYFFDQSLGRQRRKPTRKSAKSFRSISPQLESNKKSTRAKSASDGESAADDDLCGERKRRSDALLETNDHGADDDERCAEAPPAALQEEMFGEISLLDEYRQEAPDMLLELEEVLRLCEGCEEGFFPHGLGNVLNYTWRDLTDGAVCFTKRLRQPSASHHKGVRPRKLKGSATSDKPSVDTHQEKSVGAKKKCRKKTSVEEKFPQESAHLRNKPTVSNGHKSLGSHLSTTISFSMSSEVCLERGWLVQTDDQPIGDPQRMVFCRWAVEQLQLTQIRIREQNAELAEQGFTHPLVLRHYDDARRDCAAGPRRGGGACLFPPYRRPSIPEPRPEEPASPKLHYGINDGTAFLYYPSGHVAVCQSYSGLPCGGFYTIVFSDAPKATIMATFTPFGCATITHPISGAVTVWDQCGGVAYDSDGTVTREWSWPTDRRQHKPIVIEVTELISVRAWSVTSASLWFRAEQERIQLPITSLPNVAPPKNMEEVRSSENALEPSPEEAECVEAELGRKGRADPDLKRLQRAVRDILEGWLEHYRQATGISCPPLPKVKDRSPRSTHSKHKDQSAASLALGPAELEEGTLAQPPEGSTEQLAAARTVSPTHRQGREEPQLSTETGVLRIHSNVRLLPVAISRGLEPPRPAVAPPSPCPAVTRAALLGQEGQRQCRCSNRKMPLLTDLEYDAFIRGQRPHASPVLVVCVTPPAPPTGDILDQLYRAKNRNRSMPCTQCRQDSFRLLRYEVSSAHSASTTHNALLLRRNNMAPGMFLMYAGGRLLFADHIFNGYSCSARDLYKQIVETQAAYRQGQSLPSDFRFSPPVEVLMADGGSSVLQRPRGKSASFPKHHTPQTPLLFRKRIPLTYNRAQSAQDTVASLTLRRSLQQQAKRILPFPLPVLPTEQSSQRAGPRTLAPGCISGL